MRDVRTFVKKHVAEFQQAEATRAALMFLSLTAARGGERGATWGGFDLKAGIWTVPCERMKAKEPHRVPLSTAALALVKKGRRMYLGWQVDSVAVHKKAAY
ncbi:tyrosine-type recombinase/integrase [Caballeronia concitans]|uniref:Phage integrase n=1 Tax=Caballeronia concitans TaxID=1777133 RepID=A0A658R2U5_9BURK|nr:tyrosine-type recombinase/integrase [Caballeronia concitans]KIG04686.1 integrase family protein [Burkholderia sp. MR1]SAL42424.1 phage integrase [Caballeronia concitans]